MQEVAKQALFPGSGYVASDYVFSLRRGLRRRAFYSPSSFSPDGIRNPREFFRPPAASQMVPAAALALHWISTVILIAVVVQAGGSRTAADGTLYLPGLRILDTACSYGLAVVWPTIVGTIMLYRHLKSENWGYHSLVSNNLGALAALVFTVASAFPLVSIWVPNPMQLSLPRTAEAVPWFAPQTATMGVLAVGGAYWVGNKLFFWWMREARQKEWSMERMVHFARDEQGRVVVVGEVIEHRWVPRIRESVEYANFG